MLRPFLTCLVLVTVVAVASFYGCSSDSGPSNPAGTGDTTPPGMTLVVAMDANHVEITFDEDVDRATAEFRDNYTIVERAPQPSPRGRLMTMSPGDTIDVGTASLGTDNRTVTITTNEQMSNVPYDVRVRGVADVHGNAIESSTSDAFMGSDANDTTAPEIASRTPGPNASNVAVAQPVIVTFSEPMDFNSVISAVSWAHSGGSVPFDVNSEENNEFIFTPIQALALSTTYTFSISANAQDWSGNSLAATNWSFTTTAATDNTPPVLVSSSPVDGATNVSVEANFTLNFSEAINQTEIDIIVTPMTGDGVLSFTNEGRTLNFDPTENLLANTQYNVLIPPGGVIDLAGNPNNNPHTVTFSTGVSLESGSIAGTLAGHSGTAAANPAGALMAAMLRDPFSGSEGDPDIAGQSIAGVGGQYTIPNLPDNTYWIMSIMDTNGDGEVSPEMGDAFGLYGVDLSPGGSFEPDSVEVANGANVSGIDFQIYDLSAISGAVIYDGSAHDPNNVQWFLGVFDTTGFDLGDDPQTVFEDSGTFPFEAEYQLWQEDGVVAGTYYVGAFMDVNENGTFDPSDPFGLYGGVDTPTPITLANGSDALEIDVVMTDPAPSFTLRPWTVSRTRTEMPEELANLYRNVRSVMEGMER